MYKPVAYEQVYIKTKNEEKDFRKTNSRRKKQ